MLPTLTLTKSTKRIIVVLLFIATIHAMLQPGAALASANYAGFIPTSANTIFILDAQVTPIAAAPIKGCDNIARMLTEIGVPKGQITAALIIIRKESSCDYTAVNKKTFATGLCQALPAHKMASAGADYLSNPYTQLKWCHQYAIKRYGSWNNGLKFQNLHGWW